MARNRHTCLAATALLLAALIPAAANDIGLDGVFPDGPLSVELKPGAFVGVPLGVPGGREGRVEYVLTSSPAPISSVWKYCKPPGKSAVVMQGKITVDLNPYCVGSAVLGTECYETDYCAACAPYGANATQLNLPGIGVQGGGDGYEMYLIIANAGKATVNATLEWLADGTVPALAAQSSDPAYAAGCDAASRLPHTSYPITGFDNFDAANHSGPGGKIIVLTDLHCGSKYLSDEAATALQELGEQLLADPDIAWLLLTGDIYDTTVHPYQAYNPSPREIMESEGGAVCNDIITGMMERGVKVVYIGGNHDHTVFEMPEALLSERLGQPLHFVGDAFVLSTSAGPIAFHHGDMANWEHGTRFLPWDKGYLEARALGTANDTKVMSQPELYPLLMENAEERTKLFNEWAFKQKGTPTEDCAFNFYIAWLWQELAALNGSTDPNLYFDSPIQMCAPGAAGPDFPLCETLGGVRKMPWCTAANLAALTMDAEIDAEGQLFMQEILHGNLNASRPAFIAEEAKVGMNITESAMELFEVLDGAVAPTLVILGHTHVPMAEMVELGGGERRPYINAGGFARWPWAYAEIMPGETATLWKATNGGEAGAGVEWNATLLPFPNLSA